MAAPNFHDDDPHEAMSAVGWSDGLPVVPPTTERLERMLTGTTRPRDAVLGLCPPMYSRVTVEAVAVNAVLAGCDARHLRIVIAAVEAMLQPPFNIHGVHATTMGATPAVVVSGPARIECGLNSAHGALGSGSRANLCIGRAVKLVLQNVGGAKLGGTESTTLGTPMKVSMCVAENEELLECIGWAPYHAAARGFREGESCVTVVACTSGPQQLVDFATRDAATLVALLGCHLAACYAPHMPLVNEALVVISPEHATTLQRGGVASKAQLADCLWHAANRASARHLLRTIRLTAPAGGVSHAKLAVGALLALLAFALSLLADLLGALFPSRALDVLPLHSIVNGYALKAPKFVAPSSFHIVVAGAKAGKFSAVSPGFGVGLPPRPTANLSRACSAPVEPTPPTLGHMARVPALSPVLSFLATPTGEHTTVAPLAPAKRPSCLGAAGGTGSRAAQTTLGLLDISKFGGGAVLDRLQARLEAEHTGLRCRRLYKPTFSRPMPEDLVDSFDGCDAVVMALAD